MINISLKENEKIAIISDLHYDSHTPVSRIDNILEVLESKMLDILNKCILNNVKVVIFEGDIINRLQISFETVNSLILVLKKFIDKGIKLYTILGNHDIFRNSNEGIIKSPVYTLFTLGLIEHVSLENSIVVNDTMLITCVDYIEYPPKANENYKINVLVAHMFYETSELISNEDHNLTEDKVKELGYDKIFLGHDHEEYKPVIVDKTTVYRHGSVVRGTSHNYNFNRIPKFLVFSDTIDVEEVPISCNAYQDVVSSYVNNNGSGVTTIERGVLKDLAEKLTGSNLETEDVILEIIKNDENLSVKYKERLLKYIHENI